jgi:hypothetical protein
MSSPASLSFKFDVPNFLLPSLPTECRKSRSNEATSSRIVLFQILHNFHMQLSCYRGTGNGQLSGRLDVGYRAFELDLAGIEHRMVITHEILAISTD